MPVKLARIQIGKKGLSQGMLENIAKSFKTRDLVKINILKAYSRDKEKIKKESEEICKELERATNKKYSSRVVGFTIIIKKLRKK